MATVYKAVRLTEDERFTSAVVECTPYCLDYIIGQVTSPPVGTYIYAFDNPASAETFGRYNCPGDFAVLECEADIVDDPRPSYSVIYSEAVAIASWWASPEGRWTSRALPHSVWCRWARPVNVLKYFRRTGWDD